MVWVALFQSLASYQLIPSLYVLKRTRRYSLLSLNSRESKTIEDLARANFHTFVDTIMKRLIKNLFGDEY